VRSRVDTALNTIGAIKALTETPQEE
jgi:hypothetical protein